MSTSYGHRFGKPDIERLGLFSEMDYMNGKGYKPLYGKPNYLKGTNFVTSGRKTKNGTQHGYFEDTFNRLYTGEAIVRKKKVSKGESLDPFIVNSVPKKHSTPGDNYGTFTKHTPAFSPKRRVRKYKREPANFLWRCGKIGGPGYADSGIDKYPTHLPDPYGLKLHYKSSGRMLNGPFLNHIYPQPYFDKKSPFAEDSVPKHGLYLDREKANQNIKKNETSWIPNGPAKSQGGSHAGCFDKYPEFQPCRYVNMAEANKPRGSGKLGTTPFMPVSQMLKTLYTNSVLNQTVDVFMNSANCEQYVPCYIDHLLTDMYS